jgi:hypothetical protein
VWQHRDMTDATPFEDVSSDDQRVDPAAAAATPGDAPRRRHRRWPRRLAFSVAAMLAAVVLMVAVIWVELSMAGSGAPSPAARGGGHDAEWLGHAWVDGRKAQPDVDALAAALRGSGIRDLFLHAGPFNDDGTLDHALRPGAVWVIGALHKALPGVRVQAWLGAHPVSGALNLASSNTRAAMLASVGQVLDDGFDGVHLDLEPVDDGDPDLETLVADAHTITRQRHAVLSLSASLLAPSGVAAVVAALPGRYGVWSPGYLSRLAANVDQVAVMAYDTWAWTPSMYAGYVRQLTRDAWNAVPAGVALLIGVPAYHDDSLRHHRNVETMAQAIRGVRLALGDESTVRTFGVAVYVDFTVTNEDWSTYRHDWLAKP